MPLETAAIEASAEGVKSLMSLIASISEFGKARRMERNNPRPIESIPQGVLDATAYAKLLGNLGMPAQEYSKALEGIDRAGTKSVSEARDRRGGLDTISTTQQATDDALLGLSAEDSRLRVGNMQNMIGQLNTLGNWQDKIWDWNFKSKFEENAAAIRALRTAANANLGSALNTGLSAGANAATLTGNKGTTSFGGIDMNSITGGLSGNQTTLQQGSPFNDPTLTNPDLFTDGIPNELIQYMRALQLNKN